MRDICFCHSQVEGLGKWGDWDGIDAMLRQTDIETESRDILLSLVIGTFEYKGQLRERTTFFRAVRDRFVKDRGPEAAAQILDQLR